MQSNRNIIPQICPVVFDLKDLRQYRSSINLVAYEASTNFSLKSYLKTPKNDFSIIIGTEGGISATEMVFLQALGFKSISLGKRILRAETAPIFFLSAISYEQDLQ